MQFPIPRKLQLYSLRKEVGVSSRKHRFSEYTDILYYIMLYRVHLNVYRIYSHTLVHTVVSSTPQLLMAEGTD
jgi:hypothetical protein